jgi:hypothetical protein
MEELVTHGVQGLVIAPRLFQFHSKAEIESPEQIQTYPERREAERNRKHATPAQGARYQAARYNQKHACA